MKGTPFCWLVFWLIVTSACHPDKTTLVNPERLTFRTTDTSELFFKNVRKSAYEEEEMKAAGINLYHSPQLHEMPMSPQLVINWRTDQAFVLFKESTEGAAVEIWISPTRGETQHFTFDPSSHQNHAMLGAYIYNAVLNDDSVTVRYADTTVPFFGKGTEKEAFRRLFFDYLRLTEQR